MQPEYKDKLELYKLAVEMADRVSARRGVANTFFLTINTGLGAALAVFSPTGKCVQASTCDPWATVLGGGIGLVLCVVWFFALRSYRRLNAAKYAVILNLEQDLHAKPFTDEWANLKQTGVSVGQLSWWRKRWVKLKDQYTDLTNIEAAVPVVYGLIYLALIIRAIV